MLVQVSTRPVENATPLPEISSTLEGIDELAPSKEYRSWISCARCHSQLPELPVLLKLSLCPGGDNTSESVQLDIVCEGLALRGYILADSFLYNFWSGAIIEVDNGTLES